jgi:hypothetical protein
MLTVNAYHDTGCSFGRQVRADFPQTAAHRPTERHPYRPGPLHSHKVPSDHVTFDCRQCLQPLAYRFRAG